MARPRAVPPPAPLGANGFPIYGPGSLPSVGRRAIARAIDTLLIGIPLIIVAGFLWAHVGPDDKVTVETVPLWALAGSRLVYVIYESIAVAATGTTVGKALLRLRVEDPGGTKPDVHRATLRILLPCLLSLVPVVGPALTIVLFLMGGSRRPLGRTLFDQAAGTVVVSTR